MMYGYESLYQVSTLSYLFKEEKENVIVFIRKSNNGSHDKRDFADMMIVPLFRFFLCQLCNPKDIV